MEDRLYNIYADFTGKTGEVCKTRQSWTLNFQGEIIEGFTSKKKAEYEALYREREYFKQRKNNEMRMRYETKGG